MKNLPFEMDYLTDAMVELAEKELGETDEVRKDALVQFRNLIKEDPKLFCTTDDNFLVQFLRARKFNVERAYGLLTNYYTVKKSQWNVFGKTNFECLQKSVREKIINALPYRDDDGSLIIVIQLCHWNYDEMDFGTFVHALACLFLACVDSQPATQVCGVKVIIDVENIGFGYMKHLPPRLLLLIARGIMNYVPARFKEFHCVNQSPLIKYGWTIFKLIISNKIRNRVFFHSSNWESLHKHINPSILPEEYCGSLQYDNSFWVKKVDQLEDRYYELMKYGYKSV